jgi:hypothetical protein
MIIVFVIIYLAGAHSTHSACDAVNMSRIHCDYSLTGVSTLPDDEREIICGYCSSATSDATEHGAAAYPYTAYTAYTDLLTSVYHGSATFIFKSTKRANDVLLAHANHLYAGIDATLVSCKDCVLTKINRYTSLLDQKAEESFGFVLFFGGVFCWSKILGSFVARAYDLAPLNPLFSPIQLALAPRPTVEN